MAFRIQAHGTCTLFHARKHLSEAITYLKKSKLAKEILDDIESHKQIVTVKIGPGIEDHYEHPPQTHPVWAGTVFWDPEFSLGVVDRVVHPHGTARPNVPWVPNRGVWKCCGKKMGTPVNEDGVMSPKVCLMHELGHAYQYLSNPDEYREFFSEGKTLDMEDINTAAIENTVVLELRQAGCNEGIRWDYYATK